MKHLKRIFIIFILSCLCINLNACSSKPTVDFDEFIKSLPTVLIDNDALDLEFLFEQPENYGFETQILNLPLSSLEDYKETDTTIETLLNELHKYKYKKLTDEQKVTYDVLEDYLTRNQNSSEYYYLDHSYLGSFIGYQAQLPLLLKEYTFEDKNDLDSYFNVLETSVETFDKYAEIEEKRQKKKCGMSQEILDKVISQCESFSKDKNCFLIDEINKKIDKVDFLTKDEKKEAKAKNKDLVQNSFQVAYKNLGERLSKIEGNKESLGLYYNDKGTEYYEYLLNRSIGSDMSVEEIRTYFKEKMEDIASQMRALYFKHPESYEKLMELDSLSDATYSTFKSYEETIDYLKDAVAKDYPALKDLKYDVTKVPDSMKDNFSPAAYLIGKIDATNATEHIWVNGDYNQNLYETLAHEGYPGHMYEHSYIKEQNLPTIRYIIDYNGFSEGWATYVENNAWQYVEEDIDKYLLDFLNLNSQYTGCIIALMDIEIHYDGITYDQYLTRMKEFGIDTDSIDEEDLKEQYLLIVETPTNYIQYYLPGFLFQDYEDEAKEELGDDYDATTFHAVLLDHGSRSMAQVKKDVEAYIQETKKQ